MITLQDEQALRTEAMAWLAVHTHDGRDAISRDTLTQFTWRGERLPLIDQGRGIRKPRICRAALSIMTVHTGEGRARPYDDVVGADGLPRYKMRADRRGDSDNRALMQAMTLQLPVIWLVGVAPGWYQAIYPVFILGHEEAQSQFVLAYDSAQELPVPSSPLEQVLRRYALRETRQRLHQGVFRSMVMQAYEKQCAVCSLRHLELLDAAHIVADGDERGVAAVSNGLSMCKIHHAAYDAGILGVSPDYVVEIRHDILEEVDGPLFEHGIKGLHRRQLMKVPSSRRSRPDRDLLAIRHELFLSA